MQRLELFLRDAAECSEGKGIWLDTSDRKKLGSQAVKAGYGATFEGGSVRVFVMDEVKRDPYLREYYGQKESAK